MKKIFLLSIIFLTVLGCIFSKSEGVKKPGKKHKQTEINRADSTRAVIEAEINRIRQDMNYYYGIGYADIGDSYSEAMTKAKEHAMRELSRTIKSEVTFDMKRTLSNVSIADTKSYSEKEQDIIEQKSRIYTDLVLSNVQNHKKYEDYPREGVITYILKKSVAEYEEKVKTELRNNKQLISGIVMTGNNNFASGKYLAAVHNWTLAKETMNNIFGDLPLQAEIGKDSKEVELSSYLNSRVNKFFASLQITTLNGKEFVYDAQGNINQNPSLYVKYIDDYNQERHVAKLPLKVNVVEGSAKVMKQLTTGNYGQVELPINNVDGSLPFVSLKVEVDSDNIENISLFSLPPTSSLNIYLKKMRTIAISVSFNNNGNHTSPDNLMQTIKSLAIARGFAVAEIDMRKEDISNNDFSAVNQTNADYYLNVYISSTDARSVGGYDNMFKATCSGSISLYKLPHGANIASEPLRVEEGFGASAINAALNAYGKHNPKVQSIAENILKQIK